MLFTLIAISAGALLADSSMNLVAATALPEMIPDGNLGDFKSALRIQLDSCATQDAAAIWKFGMRSVTRQQWCTDTSRAFLKLAGEVTTFAELIARARNEFEWYQSVGSNGQGAVMVTGYYAPMLHGTAKPEGKFIYPLYRRPEDLQHVQVDGQWVWRRKNADGTYSKYDERRTIDADGSLKGKGLEIAYFDDAFEVSIFQVQGAGIVEIRREDGTIKRTTLNYDGENGHPLIHSAKILKNMGVAPEYLTIPGQRKYFKDHPDQLMPVLMQNPSYVFFKESEGGPVGVDGIALTSGHSVALDIKVFPVGVMTFLKTERPVMSHMGDIQGWEPFTRLALAQDTGGTIRGPGRVDFYWGEGIYAELAAGMMQQPGTLYFAVVPQPKK